MTTFLQRIPSASTTGLDLNHYRCTAGFLDLSGQAREAAILQDVRIHCTSPSARTTICAALNALVDKVHREEVQNGGQAGVLTYMAFSSLDDDVGLRILGRWASREDMERFIRRADVVAFWMENKEGMRGMEQRGYVPNGKGWLHRGSGYAGETVGKERL